MQIKLWQGKKDREYKLQSLLIIVFLILIPLTHKEMFILFDQDLMFSRIMLSLVGLVGFVIFIKKYKHYAKDIFYIFLSSVLFGQIFSLFHTLDQTSTLRLIVFQSMITFTYPFFREYTEKYGFSLIIKTYLWVFIGVFCFFVYQYVLHNYFDKLTGGIWPVFGYPTRYGATFWDINHYGAYLGSLFFMFVGYFFEFPKHKMRKFFAIGAFLTLVGLNFTDSRSALIGFIIAGLFFAYFYLSKNIHRDFKANGILGKIFYKNHLMWLSFLLLIGSFLVIFLLQDYIRTGFLYRSTSFFSHLFLLKAGISVAIDNFSTGIGANAFYAYFRESDWASAYYYIDKAAINYKLPLHNLWLEVLVETGLIAFIIFTVMWVVGIGLLVKLYRKNRDYLALGLASGIIVFLIGGLFYSYKAEFFWIYIIIALVYGSKDLDQNVVVKKFSDAKYIFYYIFESSYKFKRIAWVLLSALIVVFNLVYVTAPLNKEEVTLIYRRFDLNLVQIWITNTVDMLRYVIGNYSFTPRIVTIILYICALLIIINIFRYFIKFYKAVMFGVGVLNLVVIFRPAVYFDQTWFFVFAILVLLNLVIISFDLKQIKMPKFATSYKYFVVFLIITSVVAQVSNYTIMHTNTYDSNRAFIVELSANRSVLNNSVIWVQEEGDMPLVKYYSDHIQKVPGKWGLNYTAQNETVYNLDQLSYVNFSYKNVFIVNGLMAQRLIQALGDDVEIIRHRSEYVLIVDPPVTKTY